MFHTSLSLIFFSVIITVIIISGVGVLTGMLVKYRRKLIKCIRRKKNKTDYTLAVYRLRKLNENDCASPQLRTPTNTSNNDLDTTMHDEDVPESEVYFPNLPHPITSLNLPETPV